MKVIVMTLLGLTFCIPAWATTNIQTIHGLHQGCELQRKQDPSTADALDIGWAQGYIIGYEAATSNLYGTPKTVGEMTDAVCKYIDLHPEIWSLPSGKGLDLVLSTLYGEKK